MGFTPANKVERTGIMPVTQDASNTYKLVDVLSGRKDDAINKGTGVNGFVDDNRGALHTGKVWTLVE